MIGGDSQRLHEELIFAGGQIRQGVFRRFDSLRQAEDALNAGTAEQPAPDVQSALIDLWPKIETSVARSLAVRQEERTASLIRSLEQRQEKEISDIQAILSELAQTIQRELTHQPEQLSLFNQEESQQYARNVSALESRLGQIPSEIDAEANAIRRRYANPQARLFPVAVTWIVPARIA